MVNDTKPDWLQTVPTPHPSRQPLDRFERDCQLTMTRRSGPGGQHRNKTSTAIVLVHQPTQVSGEASESRSQAKNRSVAVQRLRLNLAVAIRCLESDDEEDAELRKKHAGRSVWVAEHNPQRPAVISLVLDDTVRYQGNLQQVAKEWRTTASQLLKLLRSETPAMDYMNRLRAFYELRPLR